MFSYVAQLSVCATFVCQLRRPFLATLSKTIPSVRMSVRIRLGSSTWHIYCSVYSFEPGGMTATSFLLNGPHTCTKNMEFRNSSTWDHNHY
jgi:hypothetical protein